MRYPISKQAIVTVLALLTLLFLTGCPEAGLPATDPYGVGFSAGFALDVWYWDGYYDGFDTIDFAPIYYDDSGIPFFDDGSFEAGYWDGVWYAYNDGYFVDYHYAFIVGFSEGYDNAYWPDYLDFLAWDIHTEFLHGGWTDGYHDGFSEGRVFGANDYEQGLNFDWLDALWDYESGTDLYFAEVNVGTGAYGPVVLYEYGTNPAKKSAAARAAGPDMATPAIRQGGLAKAVNVDGLTLYRTLTPQSQQDLDVLPALSLRSNRELLLEETWLERVTGYLNAGKKGAPQSRERSVSSSR